MVVIQYTKTQTKETEKGKQIKISFVGLKDNLVYNLSIDGSKEDIESFLLENKVSFYGQKIDLDVENKQTTLSDKNE